MIWPKTALPFIKYVIDLTAITNIICTEDGDQAGLKNV